VHVAAASENPAAKTKNAQQAGKMCSPDSQGHEVWGGGKERDSNGFK